METVEIMATDLKYGQVIFFRDRWMIIDQIEFHVGYVEVLLRSDDVHFFQTPFAFGNDETITVDTSR